MKKQKKLLILGGTLSTLDIVRTAKEMGVEVTVADNLDGGIAKSLADYVISISTTDISALAAYIKESNIDGVFTGPSEFNIQNMIRLCNECGLPVYATEEQWNLCSNKEKFKELCQKYDVPVVHGYHLNDYTAIPENITYPVIVKPVDSYSGHGISICQNEDELTIGLVKGLEFSPSKHIILEKYMKCKNVEAYYIVQNGKVKLMSLSDRITRNDQKGSPVPVAFFHPSCYIRDYIEKVNDKVCNMFEQYGFKQGVFFLEAFYDGKQFYFYEMGYRLNATMEYKFVYHFEHYNPLKFMIQYALGEEFGDQDIVDSNSSIFQGVGCELSPLLRKGKIGKIQGIDVLKKDSDIIYIHQMHDVGDVIDSTGTLDQNFARIHVVGENYKSLNKKIHFILNTLHVYDENENEMILPYKGEEVEIYE